MTAISNSGAGLTAALRTSVLALQNNQSLIESLQLRLATGKRVNGALDDPNNFFTASALGRRSTRLTNLLDGLVTKISTLKEAGEAVSSLKDLVEQAQGVVDSASTHFTGTTAEAKITGNRTLTTATDLTTDIAGIDDGDKLSFKFIDDDGSVSSASTVTISSGNSVTDLINNINNITDSSAVQVFQAGTTSNGNLEIKTKNNTRFEIEFQTSGDASNSALANALGFNQLEVTTTDNGTSNTRVTVLPSPSLTTDTLFDANTSGGATTSTTLLNLTNSSNGSASDIFDGDADDKLSISIDGGTFIDVVDDISTATLSTLIDGINNNGSLNTKIKATFDSDNNTLNIRAIDKTVDSIQFQLTEDGSGGGTAGKVDLQKLGFGINVLQSSADGSGLTTSESFDLGAGVSTLVDYENEYDDLLSQIDDLVDDSEFERINLLKGEDLISVFNETGTSTLTTTGETLNSTGLSLSAANFGSNDLVNNALSEITDALATVENFSAALETDIKIIQTRESFLEGTITNLKGGIDGLTANNTNEDEALLLVLQSRQLVGVSGLSLASRTQESVLRSF